MLLLRGVFEGTNHRVPRMATFGNPRLGGRVGKSTGGPLSTPPGPYKLKLFRELILNSKKLNNMYQIYFNWLIEYELFDQLPITGIIY